MYNIYIVMYSIYSDAHCKLYCISIGRPSVISGWFYVGRPRTIHRWRQWYNWYIGTTDNSRK